MWGSQVHVRGRFGDEGEGSGWGHGGMGYYGWIAYGGKGWEAGLVLWRRLGGFYVVRRDGVCVGILVVR